jgi:outer membrane protein assembly factor BamB
MGPNGNGVPLVSDTPLVDDLAQARLAWTSTDRDLGVAKTGSQTWVNSERVEGYLGPDANIFKGNWAGVVVADGRVYASSWRPAGEVFTAPYKTNKPYQKGETELVPTKFHVEAEDVVICFDANNGQVLWKAVEPGGLIRGGAKREGFQVACAIDDGRVFSVGSTGRLFAHDARTGTKLWQTDVGGGHKASLALKEKSLATAKGGKIVIPDEPSWFTSPVVADGVLIVSDFAGNPDVGLRGHDPKTGELKWSVPKIVSRWATPSLWRHEGKTWVLTATCSGTLQMIDPQTGTLAWQVKGLGKNMTTLGPGGSTVMVNIKPTTDKRTPGLWGAYRISPEKAELAWQLADEPQNQISTWMDNGARQHTYISGGRVLLHTQGTKEVPGRAVLLDEKDGAVLAESRRTGSDLSNIDELILWLGDRALVRADHSHGGGHPLVLWNVEPGKLAPALDEGKPGGLNLVGLDSAYEVLMHMPIVDGRIFGRLENGRLACYDLRQQPGAQTLKIDFDGAYAGMPPLKVTLWISPDAIIGAKTWIPDGEEAAMVYGTSRRRAIWERCDVSALRRQGDRITGTLRINFGTHTLPAEVDLTINGNEATGTWNRTRDAEPKTQTTTGTLAGQVSDVRGAPTPWLKDQPWTRFGTNPPGTRTIVIGLDKAIPHKDTLKGLSLSFDHDGDRFTRSGATAFQFSQAWHEVAVESLAIKDGRIGGSVKVMLNVDPWFATDESRVGTITLDASISPDNTVTGTYSAEWGTAWKISGDIRSR